MTVYELVRNFKTKYPSTVAWNIKRHAKIVEKYLNPGETVSYAFVGQKSNSSFEFINTHIVAVTNKRLIIASKRVLFGYFLYSITPDLFNDLTIESRIIWGKVSIDTVRELAIISKISKKALDEVETNVTEFLISEKKKFNNRDNEPKEKI